MQVQKFGGPPKNIWGQKHAKFRSILYNLTLWSRISPESVKTSKIWKLIDREQFLLRYTKKVRWTFDWCHFWWPWSTFEGHFSLGCHFHFHFSNRWQALASCGLPAIAELLVFLVAYVYTEHDYPTDAGGDTCSSVGLYKSIMMLAVYWAYTVSRRRPIVWLCAVLLKRSELAHLLHAKNTGPANVEQRRSGEMNRLQPIIGKNMDPTGRPAARL